VIEGGRDDGAALTLVELLTTTRTVRRRLDLDRPVARTLVEDCLRIGFQAPTGGNAQNWGWVLVDDQAMKQRMAEIYRAARDDHDLLHSSPAASASGVDTRRMSDAGRALAANLERVPVLLVPAFAPRYSTATTFGQATLWGSILPAVWNFMLALRLHGLGSAWTTIHLHREGEMAQLLGIPEGYTQAGLFPVAYTLGREFKPGDRRYSETRIFWNEWLDRQPLARQ
jgi:nitroreductase